MPEDVLKNIKEDIYKCSKCGLCQSVCPVYLALKNEMFLTRGRCIVLNNFFNNKKNLNKKFINQLDICLNCNLCKNFCPSGINASNINIFIKNALKYKYSVFNFSFLYKIYLLFKRYFSFGYYNARVKRKKFQSGLLKGHVAYFEGCCNKYINPSDKNASLNLIEKSGYKIKKIISACCGYPYLQEGSLKQFKQNGLKINKQIPSDISYIISSCDSCYEMLKKVLDDKNRSVLIRLDDFLKLNSYNISSCQDALYFKPLIRKDDVYLPFNTKTLNKKGICSLMENFFILKYKKPALKILKETFVPKSEIDNKTIYTSCLISKSGLKKEAELLKSNADILSYAEFLELFNSDNR